MHNPNQPRLPAGDRYGGRWTGTGLGGGPAGPHERAPRPRGGIQVANAGTLAQGLRGLGPFGPAMIPYLLGVLARMAEGGLDRIGFLGGLVVAVVSAFAAAPFVAEAVAIPHPFQAAFMGATAATKKPALQRAPARLPPPSVTR